VERRRRAWEEHRGRQWKDFERARCALNALLKGHHPPLYRRPVSRELDGSPQKKTSAIASLLDVGLEDRWLLLALKRPTFGPT
jgi:hypothetical protein